MKECFTISVTVVPPIVIGQDEKNGRRQLIPIINGILEGVDPEGKPLKGTVLPGGVDSQVIRPDGNASSLPGMEFCWMTGLPSILKTMESVRFRRNMLQRSSTAGSSILPFTTLLPSPRLRSMPESWTGWKTISSSAKPCGKPPLSKSPIT